MNAAVQVRLDPGASPLLDSPLFRSTIGTHSKSFSLAARLLPEGCRSAARALYAWCRTVDDAVDSAAPELQPVHVAQLQQQLRSTYAGLPLPDLTWSAFQHVAFRFRIPLVYPAELVAGMNMDAERYRYETRDDLLLYCYRVAGTVGLMMAHLMGVSDPRALRHAAHLGMAMQLTNICRDVAEDWERGRLYIPLELLNGREEWTQPGATPLTRANVSPLNSAVPLLLRDADRLYRSAEDGLQYLPWRAAFAVRSAGSIYSAIGTRIAGLQHDVLAGRAYVPLSGKLGAIVASAFAELGRLPTRLERPFTARDLDVVVRYPDDVVPV